MPDKTPRGFEQLTVSTVAVPLASIPAPSSNLPGANWALIRCETANVRWRDDGTAPTASVGQLLQVGETLSYDGNLTALKFIRKDAADATIDASYYRNQS